MKKIVVFLFTLISLFALFIVGANAETSGLYTYSINADSTATVTKVDLSISGNIEIPPVLDEHSVTAIGESAFEACKNTTSIKIPDGVKTIAEFAFAGNTNLVSIDIPSSVTFIGYAAFIGCDSLESLALPDNIEQLESQIFYGLKGLTSVTLPKNLKSIDSSTFEGCTSLANITIQDSVTSIGSYAFADCTSLTSITIPNSVTSIGIFAFNNCTSLTSITLPFVGSSRTANGTADAVFGSIFGYYSTNVSGSTLQYYKNDNNNYYMIPNSLKTVTITDTKQIPYGAFYGCSNLTSISIPNSVTSFGAYSFYICSNITSMVLPNGITTIPSSMLGFCSSLKSITISEGVTSIGNEAFYECSNLSEVLLPDSLTSIGMGTFSQCQSLTKITLPEGLVTLGDAAFSCTGLTSIVIPNGVTVIGTAIFSGCTSLESVALPENLDCIGYLSFSECSSLASIHIPNNVTTLYNSAFTNCTSLTSVIIPNKATTIGDYAFQNCTGLTGIFIPSSVTSIGADVFYGCNNVIIFCYPFTYATNYASNNSMKYSVVGAITNLGFKNVDSTINFTFKYLFLPESVTIEQSTDNINWVSTNAVISEGSATLSDVPLHTIYYFRVNVVGGYNEGISNVVTVNLKSDSCNILEWLSPQSDNVIVPNYTNTMNITLDVGYGTFKIYADSNCNTLLSNPVNLNVSVNTFYIKVYSESYKNSRVYPLTITRGGKLDPVICDMPSGYYLKDKTYFSLATVSANAKIYYTTDGTNPSSNSTLYTTHVLISKNMTVRAVAILAGYDNSDVTTINYHMANETILMQLQPPTTTSAILNFNVQTGATNVEVLRCTSDYTAYYGATLALPINSTSTTATVINLEPSTTYYFKIRVTYKDAYIESVPIMGTTAPFVSSDCNILSANSPSGALINHVAETVVGANVLNMQDKIVIDVTLSSNKASWGLYASKTSLRAIENNIMPLNVGNNSAYIKVTAEDGTVKFYKITIYRQSKSLEPVLSLSVTHVKIGTVLEISALGSSIKYTTDNSEPSATNGILYTEPIIINSNMTLKVMAMESGKDEYSNVITKNFIVVSNEISTEVLSVSKVSGGYNCNFDLLNNMDVGMNAFVIFALYDENNKLIGTKKVKITLQALSLIEQPLNLTINTDKTAASYKIFVWDIASFRPFSVLNYGVL